MKLHYSKSYEFFCTCYRSFRDTLSLKNRPPDKIGILVLRICFVLMLKTGRQNKSVAQDWQAKQKCAGVVCSYLCCKCQDSDKI